MATMRFSLVGVALRALETETWLKVVSDCLGSSMSVKVKRSGSMKETIWASPMQKQQEEVRSLCSHAIHKLIPMAGSYQMNILDSVTQAATLYAPEEAEYIYYEGNKMVEEISGHISGILLNAGKMHENDHLANQEIDALRFHVSRLNEIMHIA